MLSGISGDSLTTVPQSARADGKIASLHRSSLDLLACAGAATWAAVNLHPAAGPAMVLLPALNLCMAPRPKAPPAAVAAAGCGGYWLGNQVGACFGKGIMERLACTGIGGIVGCLGAQVAINELGTRAAVRAGMRQASRQSGVIARLPWRYGAWEINDGLAPAMVCSARRRRWMACRDC